MTLPFSMLNPPIHKPYAIGEGHQHVPLIPDMSGQAAVDSLIGYYPTKGMDSQINPHTYKNPSVLRSTTMPNTKTAFNDNYFGAYAHRKATAYGNPDRGANYDILNARQRVIRNYAEVQRKRYAQAAGGEFSTGEISNILGARALGDDRPIGTPHHAAGMIEASKQDASSKQEHARQAVEHDQQTALQERKQLDYIASENKRHAADALIRQQQTANSAYPSLGTIAATGGGAALGGFGGHQLYKYLVDDKDETMTGRTLSSLAGAGLGGAGGYLASNMLGATKAAGIKKFVANLMEKSGFAPPKLTIPPAPAAAPAAAPAPQVTPAAPAMERYSPLPKPYRPPAPNPLAGPVETSPPVNLQLQHRAQPLSDVDRKYNAKDDRVYSIYPDEDGIVNRPINRDLKGYTDGPQLQGEKPTWLLDRYRLNYRPYTQQPILFKDAAVMRSRYATIKLASLQLHRSDFVLGFLAKCAEAQLQPQQTLDAVQAAMQTHRHIAAEFEKCGMEKLAVGSGNGLQMPWMQPGTGIVPGATKPVAPKLQPPVIAAKPPAPPATSATPIIPGGAGGVAQRAYTSVGNAATAGSRLLRGAGGVAGGAIWSAGSLPAQLVGRGIDAAGWAEGMGAKADGFARPGHDAMRAGFTTIRQGLSPMSSEPAPPPTDAVEQMQQQQRGQLRNGQGVLGLSPQRAAGLHGFLTGTSDAALHAIPTGVVAGPSLGWFGTGGTPSVASRAAATALGFQGYASPPANLATSAAWNAGATGNLSKDVDNTLMGTPSYQQGATPPDQAVAEAGQPPAVQPSAPQPEQAAATPAQEPAPSPITQTPIFNGVKNLIGQDPQQAQQFHELVTQQLDKSIKTTEGEAAAKAVAAGTVPPAVQQAATNAWTEKGYDLKTATQNAKAMSGWEQLGLWGGIGLAGLSLIYAMSGGDGIASIIMGILGLGAAGFSAAKGGLLDQGSKDLAEGLTDAFNPDPNAPQLSSTMKSMLPTALGDATQTFGKTFGGGINSVRDAGVQKMLQSLASDPAIAKKMDRAAGVGSWGNQLLSQGGSASGMRQSMMESQLGIKGPQQEKLLELWRNMRMQSQQTK